MWSSFRKRWGTSCPRSGALALVGTCTLAGGIAHAADTYVQPQVDLRAESNDNFDLDPEGADSNVYGLIADMQAMIGIATPRSDTSVRPRLKFQEYPDRDDLQKWEGFFDLRSDYRWERSRFLVLARYAQQDSFNADLPGGEFDPLDPTDPLNPGTGQLKVGETRTRFDVRPSIVFDATERVRVGAGADYQLVKYDADGVPSQTDYAYWSADTFVSWAVTPTSDVSAGAYVGKYEADDDSTETDSYGAELGYKYGWSEVSGLELNVFYEQNDTTDFLPVPGEESSSGWGGTLIGYYKGEISEWRMSAGRTFIPTGSGGKAESDQLRAQYKRDLTQRLGFLGAARYEGRTALTDRGADDNRDYARADLELKWMITPTWYVRGGYSYIWQERESDDDDASNNKLFLAVGYTGLERPN